MVVRPIEKPIAKELEIVKRFAEFGFQVHPEAIALLARYDGNGSAHRDGNLAALAEGVTKSIDPSICVISPEQIAAYFTRKRTREHEEGRARMPDQVAAQIPDQVARELPGVDIIRSFPEHGWAADHRDFLPYFLDRYERLSGIIKKRLKCVQIRAVRSSQEGEETSVVGIVSSIAKTAKGNLRVELEDTTGSIPVILPFHEELIPDEIIGVTGFVSSGGLFIANKITYPDVPRAASMTQSSLTTTGEGEEGEKTKPIYAVFISDMHVGSTTFLQEAWDGFVHWLKEKAERMNIGYLVVAGDVVDGIGIYPGQEADLMITDIEAQYKTAASYFHAVPRHVHLVVAPGNHDAVRGAEPQPPLPEHIRRLFPENTVFTSNPAYIRIGGRQVLIYHGQSYDDFVNAVSRLSYAKPADVMAEMLRRRHLAPIYGSSVSIVPHSSDYGVIDPVPDIFQCGHTHTVGLAKHRQVLLINSGTWQAQTPYQKKRDITPVAGCATVVELNSLKVKVMDFQSRAGA
jgi:DNA polymerase II small subunit